MFNFSKIILCYLTRILKVHRRKSIKRFWGDMCRDINIEKTFEVVFIVRILICDMKKV